MEPNQRTTSTNNSGLGRTSMDGEQRVAKLLRLRLHLPSVVSTELLFRRAPSSTLSEHRVAERRATERRAHGRRLCGEHGGRRSPHAPLKPRQQLLKCNDNNSSSHHHVSKSSHANSSMCGRSCGQLHATFMLHSRGQQFHVAYNIQRRQDISSKHLLLSDTLNARPRTSLISCGHPP
ncbi:hypothetical protein Dimus_026831 [Dionaea muscipula]